VWGLREKFDEDESKWSLTALLHDFDYEIHPEAPDHPMKGKKILAERGDDPEIRRAILSHANYSGVSRDSLLAKTLFACDELAVFLTAYSYVKPNRSIHEVETKSVRKKLKDKAFARSVNREDIIEGAAGWVSTWTNISSSASKPCSSVRRSWVWRERNL
jgi:predicted hydrolase (HD superfamily)